MPLPKHVDLTVCVPDPAGRVNHIYHEPSDEVFHVDQDTFNQVVIHADDAAKARPKTKTKKAEAPPEPPAGTPVPGPTVEELRTMATDLELDVAEDADEATLREAVEAALHG